MKIEVVNSINLAEILSKINDKRVWLFAAEEWYRLISPYTPHNTGNLEQNVTIGSAFTGGLLESKGTITYNVPYSLPVYYGKNMNFRKDHNPKASAEWDKRAIQEKQDEKLIEATAKFIKNFIR